MALVLLRRHPGRIARGLVERPAHLIAIGGLIFFVLLALFAPVLAPYRPSIQIDITGLLNQAPSWQHPLGTDLFSRDIWGRLLYGARVSLGVGALAMFVAVAVGGVVGAVAGYFGRAADAILMRSVDVGLAVPRIFMVLVVTALWEHLAVLPLILLLGLTGWFGTSRLVRAEVLVLRDALFVDGARAIGLSPWRTVFRHVVPNAAAPLIVTATLGIGSVMLLEAALSFLGVGVQPPTPSWGNMIADGRDQLATAPWTTIFPGLAIAMVVMSLNSVGDALHHALDPRLGTGHYLAGGGLGRRRR